MSGAEVAACLIFDYWPSEHPQVPGLLIVDLAATGEPGKAVLRRLRGAAPRGNVSAVVFSARPAPLDELEASWLGAMNVPKPIDSDEYDVEVARVIDHLFLDRA